MEKVILSCDGVADYLFEIDSFADLADAIEFKNDIRAEDDDEFEDYSDFEIIIHYLDEHEICYDYIDLYDLDSLEY